VRYRVLGSNFGVQPTTLTLPRGVATQINTFGAGLEALSPTAAVRATLRGPSFPGALEITATPGQPIFLPPFAQPGIHFLENIRLEIDATTKINASPTVVNINVLDQLLVGAVTSRPLTLEEIQARGIQFDENSFQAFMFTIALTTTSGVKNIEMPVLVPVGGGQFQQDAGLQVPQLTLQQLPGLELPNFGLEPLMLEPIEDAPPGVVIPPIPGILVIPGNIAFLNQFFSVFLTVSNRAPDGTPLVVRNVRAEIRLPAGADGVVGNLQRDPPFAPGEPEFDNPLRIARTAAGREILKPVLAPGPDGVPGTADDINVLVPQGSGSTEFLVEGIREGGHVIDIEIRGTLEGLPSGPIEVAGHARGAVVVRDPNFALTFIHPDVVRAGTQYDLIVQIRNTSLVDANLVTVSLDPRNLTGARLANPQHASQTIPTIKAGDSASVTLRLEALRTGRVNASTLELAGETGIVTGRRLSLRAGVSETGVPLSSDTLILPPEVARLRARANNDDLTSRAVALLGEAHSIATAPRASLPVGVLPIPASMVVQRAGELTQSALRLRLSYRPGAEGNAEPLPESLLLTLQDLYFDFLGARVRDDGWDALYRSSRQARLFGAALAEVLAREATTLGLLDPIALQRHWADTESYRADHFTATTTGTGGVPVVMEIFDRLGRSVGGSLDPEGGRRTIPGADVITFESETIPIGQFVALTRIDAAPYTATLTALRNGTADVGFAVTDASGQLRHVVFRGIAVTSGERLSFTIRPRSSTPVTFERGGTAVPPTSEEAIVDGPPQVLGIVQIADASVDQFGRVVGILFDKDVDKISAENAGAYTPGSATIPMIHPPALVDTNQVGRAFVQFGGRVVLVGLRDPVGPFVTRTLDVSGVRDLKDQVMLPLGTRILPDPDIGRGGQVTGRVLRADGSQVAGAEITYLQPVDTPFGIQMQILTVKPSDAEGRYNLDFVLQNPLGGFIIKARDVASGEQGAVTTAVRGQGERLSLDIVLVGRGSIQGSVRGPDGTPLTNVQVRIVSGTDFSTYAAGTDQNGAYRVTGVPVGPVALEVVTQIGTARASGVITASGSTTRIDLTVFGNAEGVVIGLVRLPDGSNAAGMQVTLASEPGGAATAAAFIDARTTDAAGTFRFDRVPAGGFLVRALDNARGLVGDARSTVTSANGPENPVSVVVFVGGTGSVSGQVVEQVGAAAVPVAGALVAGGTEIVRTDAQGRYLIPAVPIGTRLIEAANPITGARGSREVTILTAGQASTGIDIVLAPLARVTGRVLSPDGQPVAGQEVRIIIAEAPTGLGGRTFFVRKAQTAADGTYSFDQLEPREYPLTAVRGGEVANGRARLSNLVLLDVVDLRLIRPAGRVAGRVIDESGLAVAAQIAVRARVPNAAGILELSNAGTTISDPDRGFSVSGLFPGPFTVTASSFFSPDNAVASGVLLESNPVVDNITLVLAKNTGSLRGCVLTPEGTTIAPVLDGTGTPLPLSVFITSPRLRGELEQDPLNTEPDGIRVDASTGCFRSSIPLPPDFYTIEVTDTRQGSSTFGLTGQAFASVERAAEANTDVRLLGLGSLAIEVVDMNGQALPGVKVVVKRTSYPNDSREALLTAPTSTNPSIVEGLTEGPVSVSATVSLDPAVDVGGRDDLRGFGGHAAGKVVRDDRQIIRVVIDAAGIVSGRFVRADGTTPVPNAQIQLMAPDRPMAFSLTDLNGAFRFEGVRVGSFELDGFDPATGRRGRVAGHLQQDRQHVIQDLRLGPLGIVRGVVVDITRTQPQAGADVRLTIPNDTSGPRRVTTAADGTFVFESVPGGSLTLSALSLSGLSGGATAVLTTEGEIVQVQVALEGSGRIEGIVRSATGSSVAGADVTSIDSFGARRSVQAGTNGADTGRFAFDLVPIGVFTLEARPPGALIPGDGGRASGEITSNGQTAIVDITLQGTVTVGALVTGAVGPAPVEVSLQSGGLFGGRAVPTDVTNGVFTFESIPRAPMTVSARQQTPAGVTISASVTLGQGDLPPPGGRVTPDVQLALSQVATVRGIVTAPGGGPVSGARVTLTAGTLSNLALTRSDGLFEFVGVPLNVALRVEADGSSGGRAVFVGTIDAGGNVRDGAGSVKDAVALSLDVTPPRVAAVSPPQGAIAVPTNSVLTITFTEPVDPASITSCTTPGSTPTPSIRLLESSGAPVSINDAANLCDDSNIIPVSLVVAADGHTVTVQPARGFVGLTQHTVTISRGFVGATGDLSGGVRDLVGFPLEADFTWQFATRDDVPPVVLTISPPAGAANVAEESVIRVTFAEPIAAGSLSSASLAIVGPNGPVAGVRELILGGAVALFTPTDIGGDRTLLQSNASYTVTVSGVVDLAGNVQRPQDTATATFSTRDTIAPTIATLSAPTGGRSGQSVTVAATTVNTDVASVQFLVDGVLTATTSQPAAPGQYQASIVMPARSIQVTARAIDTSGNVGPLSTVAAIALLPDDPPTVTIVAPAAGATAKAGEIVRFVVEASDDVGVTEIRAAASGVVTMTETRIVSPPALSTNVFFDVAIPVASPAGTLTFAVAAIDTKAQTSATPTVTVSVSGPQPPSIALEPNTGRQAQTLSVTITGQNTHFVQGVTTVSFGNGITVNSLNVASATSATANITIGTGAPLGPHTVTVTTGNESASLAGGFTVFPETARVTMFLDTFDGENNETATLNFFDFTKWIVSDGSVDLLGNGILDFQPGHGLYVDLDGSTFAAGRLSMRTPLVLDQGVYELEFELAGSQRGDDNTVLVQFGDLINESITLASDVPFTQTRRTFVVNVRTTATLSFDDLGEDTWGLLLDDVMVTRLVEAPTIVANAPASGRQGQTLDVVVTGGLTHFAHGITTADFGSGVTVNTVTVTGLTSATVNVSIAPDAAPGARTLTVITGAEVLSRTDAFLVLPSVAAVASVSPAAGAQGQLLDVTITGQGTHFVDGLTTATFGPDIVVNSVRVDGATSATANLTIAFNALVGLRTVTVTTGTESASLVDGFAVLLGPARLVSVSPAIGRQSTTISVAVVGEFTHFAQGGTSASFGPGITVNSLVVASATSATANIEIDAAAPPGARTVTLTTGGEIASLTNGFTVQPGSPLLLSATPNGGQRGRELTVVVTGRFTNFLQGTTTAHFGAGISVGGAAAGESGPVTVTSPESLTANLVIDASAALGPRDVVIQFDSQTLTLAGGFTVTDSLSVEIANSLNEFSCTQGMHNWYYGYYDGPFVGADFSQMTACIDDPYYPGKSWWVDQARFWTSIRSLISFPNGPISCGREPVEQWAVRRWSSEVAGVVTVTGTVYTALGGDFRAHILVDGVSVFTQLVSETTPIPYSVTFPVALGSTVDFTIQPNGSDCDDHAAFTATIVADASIAGPIVTSVSPPDGASGISVDATVRVTFSKAVNPSTVTASTFHLLESGTPPLVVNGAFDTSATAWTVSNVDGSGGWFASGGNPGGYFILNDSPGPADPTISQTIVGLEVGRRYRVSGQYRSEYSSFGDPAALSFGVAVDGVLLGELARPAGTGWQPFAFDFTATSTSATLAISAERNGDDSSYGIDNIALEPFVEGSVVVAGDAGSATFTPAAALNSSSRYRVEVSGVADPAGTAMTVPFTSSFMTTLPAGVVYVQTWESGVDGWTSKHGDADPIVLTADPSAPTPPMVHQVTRVDSAGNYFSPPITLRAARSYCLSVSIRWVGGGWPFVGIDSPGETWLIGSPAGGAATTVSPDTTEWRRYSALITFADDVTTIRIKHELWAGAAKPGADLAYFDNFVLEEGACPAAPVLPRIVSVTPAAGRQGDTLLVDVIGEFTHFAQGGTSASFGTGITVNSLVVASATSATANIAIDAAGPPGARTVVLTTGGETVSLTDGFTVQPGLPVISFVSPSVGSQGETIDVLVTSRFTNFVQGTTTASFGEGVVVNSVVVQSATSARVNITIAQSAAVGGRVVTLTTSAEVASLAGGFVVTSAPVPIAPDADGDSFPDVVENEAGSNPLDPASTPISVQPPITQVVSVPFSVLNTNNLAGSTNPALFIGQAAGAPFAVLNTSDLSGTSNPALFVGQAASAPFAVLNNTNLNGTTNPALFVGQATSAPFAVLNNTDLNGTTNLSVFIGQAVSPFFAVQNVVFEPALEAAGNDAGVAILPMDHAVLAPDGSASYLFTVIVPVDLPSNILFIGIVGVGDVVVQRQ
jgi:hypothetical protein